MDIIGLFLIGFISISEFSILTVFGLHRPDAGVLHVREICEIGKHSKGVAHCDKTHSPAQSCDGRSSARHPRIFYLLEWQEARGVLRSIDIVDGGLGFEGFIVRIPPRLLEPLSCLHALIGEKVRIIRTDSMIHPLVVRVMQSSSQECHCDGRCHESNSNTRCLEDTDVARCSRYNQV